MYTCVLIYIVEQSGSSLRHTYIHTYIHPLTFSRVQGIKGILDLLAYQAAADGASTSLDMLGLPRVFPGSNRKLIFHRHHGRWYCHRAVVDQSTMLLLEEEELLLLLLVLKFSLPCSRLLFVFCVCVRAGRDGWMNGW